MSKVEEIRIVYQPFESDLDTSFFFEGDEHKEALARLIYLVTDKGTGMGALTGEIGSGKSLLLKVLREKLDTNYYLPVYLNTPFLEFDNILSEVIYQILKFTKSNITSIPEKKFDKMKLFEYLITEQLPAENKHLLSMIDEAHILSTNCLQEIKFLSNYNHSSNASMTIILTGQTELKATLRQSPEIYQRLGMFYHLNYMQKNKILPYLNHRLEKAEADPLIQFDEMGIDDLYNFSKGCPRQINRVAKLALHKSVSEYCPFVSKRTLNTIINDIRMHFG